MSSTFQIGIVGARGHVGTELLRLLDRHPALRLGLAVSRTHAGKPLSVVDASLASDLHYQDLDASAVAGMGLDALILALPNGLAAPYVEAVERAAPATVVLDLSADHRFDPDWHYGLPELTRASAPGHKRISNPGCYASAMQLAIAPLRALLAGPVQCFGVSGYSGAGTTPSDRNDPELLRDNLMPYALIGHVHEREVSRQLDWPVEFMPHVAAHFRGLSVTCNLHLGAPATQAALWQRYRDAYADEALIRLSDAPPWLSAVAGQHWAGIGGLSVAADGRRAVLVATLDNLLKGAATQALQNLNLALGLPETMGIPQ